MKLKTTYQVSSLILMLWINLFPVDIFSQVSPSEIEYPYNHLSWFTIESEHFLIHYQEGSEKSALAASYVAEHVYTPITELYNHQPDRKISIVLRDREDYSNGAAYFFDDMIEIWIPPLDTPLRGTHQWMRNVITHEFTHMVQLGASMKRTDLIPSIYFQWLSYEDVRRPDVLYGSPNGIVTMPFSTVSIPAWFAEGVAQYQRENIFHDFWDSHRDMILRTAVLNDTYLDFVEMGNFSSKTSLERELVYNQGFDFVNYLTDRFGEQIISEISESSSESSSNFNVVMEQTTGISGETLFEEWIESRKKKYSAQSERLSPIDAVSIEEKGYLNFYPQFNNQGDTFAYLTNRGRDYGRTKLVIKKTGSTIEIENPGTQKGFDTNQNYSSVHQVHSGETIDFISNRFSFSPNGDQLSYSKSEKNRLGEIYQDIYIFDSETRKSKRITSGERVQDPAWHPTKQQVLAVKLKDGTQNLVVIGLDSKNQTRLTNFNDGETVYTPVWSPDGKEIYFSMAISGSRNIKKYNLESGEITAVFEHHLRDFRDPWIDPSDQYLYFSSDADGIFNIYRQHSRDKRIQKITDVQGGAFMPFVVNDSLYFSEYKKGGYKISALPVYSFNETHSKNELITGSQKNLSTVLSKENQQVQSPYSEIEDLFIKYDSLSVSGDSEQISIQHPDSTSYSLIVRPYNQTTTGLSITPVIRFDNYSKLKGSNSQLFKRGQFGNLGKNLVRDFKAGAYFSSRDVTESLNIFAGALFGWGSVEADNLSDFFSPNRINNLDRDLFLIVDHKGIPFIERSWSPTISVELYNLQRNVRDGLGIEEFPCTSCLPVQKSIDIRYNVWEANLFFRSKLNRWSLLELGASYSPYSVSTDGFFSDEFREFIPGSTTEYFKGTSYSASYVADLMLPTQNADIAPEGWKSSATVRVENGRLLQEFEIDDGSLSPVYSKKTNYSFEWITRYGLPINETLNGLLTTRAFTYFNNPDDYFYLDYAGGLTGMRSYPYFAIGGHRTAFGRLSILSPIKQNMNRQLGAYTFDKLYAHLFFEVGNGWGGPLEIGKNLKTGIGTELRFALNSYYLYPLKFFINTTYGFSRFNVTLPSQFISASSENSVKYGGEVLFYFGLTFDFNQL